LSFEVPAWKLHALEANGDPLGSHTLLLSSDPQTMVSKAAFHSDPSADVRPVETQNSIR
jgi:hypothetical protein